MLYGQLMRVLLFIVYNQYVFIYVKPKSLYSAKTKLLIWLGSGGDKMRTVTLKCYRCGKDNDVVDMRYAALNRMICKTCMEKGRNPPINDPVSSKKSKFSTFEPKKDINSPKEDIKEPIVEYVCSGCHYTFKRKKSANVFSCPYCNAEGTLELKSGKTADHFIKESTGERYDM
jgi:DNA-directed RNA polymerase subunit RPC12/RpoP